MFLVVFGLGVMVLGCTKGAQSPPAGDRLQGLMSNSDIAALIAVGNGVSDATPVFRRILQKAAPRSVFEVPEGIYRLTETLELPPTDFTLKGQGPTSTILLFDIPADSHGIVWRSNETAPDRSAVRIADLSLFAKSRQDLEHAAISVSYVDESYYTMSSIIENVRIAPDLDSPPNTGLFGNGIVLTNTRSSIIEKAWIFKAQKASIAYLGEGTDSRINSSFLFEARTGVIIQGPSEGIQIQGSSIIFCEIGVSGNNPGEPQFQAIGNNFNTSIAGIILQSPLGAVISDNTFYSNAVDPQRLSPDQSYVGVSIRPAANVESRYNKITQNSFFMGGEPRPKNHYGIVFESMVKNSIISENVFGEYHQAVYLGAGTRRNLVTNNLGEMDGDTTLPAVRDLGSNNRILESNLFYVP